MQLRIRVQWLFMCVSQLQRLLFFIFIFIIIIIIIMFIIIIINGIIITIISGIIIVIINNNMVNIIISSSSISRSSSSSSGSLFLQHLPVTYLSAAYNPSRPKQNFPGRSYLAVVVAPRGGVFYLVGCVIYHLVWGISTPKTNLILTVLPQMPYLSEKHGKNCSKLAKMTLLNFY